MTTRTRASLADRPIADALNESGRTLDVGDTAAAARALLANDAVRVVPVLEGGRYVGAVDRSLVGPAVPDDAPIGTIARHLLPTVPASLRAGEAFVLADGWRTLRLVVLAEDGATYLGIVCLRSDRERLCVHAGRADV